jgi:hypothetical protein
MGTTMTVRPGRVVGLASVLVVGVAIAMQNLPVASAVTTTVGEVFKPDAGNTCVPGFGNTSLELFQTAREDGTSYAVPTDGVITSWSFHGTGTQPGIVTLRVYRHTASGGADEFTTVAQDGEPRSLLGDRLFVYATRIPVIAGDVIGLRAQTPGGICASTGGTGDMYRSLATANPGPIGASASYPEISGLKIDVAADVETDVDGDGYGDETQDACPRLASTQAPCPPATRITHKAANPTRHRTARFRFISDVPTATFQCRLGTHPYKVCTSPHVITVRPGRHTFKVRAKLGNAVDPTPASYRWRVRR